MYDKVIRRVQQEARCDACGRTLLPGMFYNMTTLPDKTKAISCSKCEDFVDECITDLHGTYSPQVFNIWLKEKYPMIAKRWRSNG